MILYVKIFVGKLKRTMTHPIPVESLREVTLGAASVWPRPYAWQAESRLKQLTVQAKGLEG